MLAEIWSWRISANKPVSSYSGAPSSGARRLLALILAGALMVGAGGGDGGVSSLANKLDFLHRGFLNNWFYSSPLDGLGGEGGLNRAWMAEGAAVKRDCLGFPGEDSAEVAANSKRSTNVDSAILGHRIGLAVAGQDGPAFLFLVKSRISRSLPTLFFVSPGPSGFVPGTGRDGRGWRRVAGGAVGLDRVSTVVLRVLCAKVLGLYVIFGFFQVPLCNFVPTA